MALEEYKCNNINEDVTRNRLLKLRDHSKKLADLKAQLISIKNANFVRNIGEICAICVIENDEIIFTFFIDNETEIAFSLLQANFGRKCANIYENYINHQAIYQIFHLVDITYTLFIKSTQKRNKHLIFLMKGEENINEIKSYTLLNLLQLFINNICFSLQNNNKKNKNNKNNDEYISTPTALIEIGNEVFGGVQSIADNNEIILDEIEFTMAMNIRLGLECNKNDLEQLFYAIIENVNACANAINEEEYELEYGLCVAFNDFVEYFDQIFVNKNILNQWNEIKDAIYKSPLSKRNKILRDKNNISVLNINDKLRQIEKMIDLLEEILILNELNPDAFEDEIYWRSKILKHRECIRLFQDSILTQILNENHKMQEKYNKLMKIKSIVNDNKRLQEIESKFYQLLADKKNDEKTMKKVEILIKKKNDEIYKLKSELMNYKKYEINVEHLHGSDDNNNNRIVVGNENQREEIVNNGLLKLKTQIVEKKLSVEKELGLLQTASMEHCEDEPQILSIRT